MKRSQVKPAYFDGSPVYDLTSRTLKLSLNLLLRRCCSIRTVFYATPSVSFTVFYLKQVLQQLQESENELEAGRSLLRRHLVNFGGGEQKIK